jgi:hypothetical protein
VRPVAAILEVVERGVAGDGLEHERAEEKAEEGKSEAVVAQNPSHRQRWPMPIASERAIPAAIRTT